jgi:heme/copper-type cytochrome/quinol oxidase subunit 2
VSLPVRVGTLLVAFLAVVGGAIFVVIHFFLSSPPVVTYSATTTAAGPVVHVVMQEDPQNTVTNRPDWVSYFIQDPVSHAWVHTTIFQVPAGARVDMTVLGYDGCTPLRNPYWGKVTGTLGNVEFVNGKPVTFLNTWSQCTVGHTFSIPGIGLNVPIAAPTTLAANSSLCSTSPCTSGPRKVVQFSYIAPRQAGDYFWQCRIPCGLGYLDGFGGPMQTIGYMTGQMEVS